MAFARMALPCDGALTVTPVVVLPLMVLPSPPAVPPTLQPVLHIRNDKGYGDYNWGNYKDPEFDALIDAAKGEVDAKKRQGIINQAMKLHHDQVYHIPLHLQVIPWASRANVEVIHRADNGLQATWIKIK